MWLFGWTDAPTTGQGFFIRVGSTPLTFPGIRSDWNPFTVSQLRRQKLCFLARLTGKARSCLHRRQLSEKLGPKKVTKGGKAPLITANSLNPAPPSKISTFPAPKVNASYIQFKSQKIEWLFEWLEMGMKSQSSFVVFNSQTSIVRSPWETT